jgi:prepilin-type N-terminal cleavage/methylation domain-containing protein
LHADKRGFTLLEVLVTLTIFGAIVAAIFASLNIGKLSFSIGSSKVEVQAKARLITDWIVNDSRQALLSDIVDIVNNSPSSSHIRFRQVTGIDITTGQYILSPDFIDYTYDFTTQKIIRSVIDPSGNTLITETREFNNIINPPFFSVDGAGVTVPLTAADLSNSQRLIIVIQTQKQLRGTISIPHAIRAEVKIRNA